MKRQKPKEVLGISFDMASIRFDFKNYPFLCIRNQDSGSESV